MKTLIAGAAVVAALSWSSAVFACGSRMAPTASTETSAPPVQTASVPSTTATR